MNRRRKNRSDVDSLDLLLDALCNMFGGIIFIALLIVLLSSDASKPSSNINPTAHVAMETKILIIESKSLEEDLDLALDNNLSSRSAIHKALKILEQAKEQNGRTLIALDKDAQIKENEKKSVFQAQTELKRLVTLAEELETSLHSPNQDDIVDAISDERRAIQKIKQQINSIDQRRVLHARLPRERQTNLTIVWMIIENNRAYVVLPSNGGWEDYEKRDVTSTKAGATSYRFTTISNGGFTISDSVSTHPRFVELTTKFPTSRYLLKMVVRNDSHKQFQQFKAALIHHGYSYNLILDESDLVLSLGNPDTSAQ